MNECQLTCFTCIRSTNLPDGICRHDGKTSIKDKQIQLKSAEEQKENIILNSLDTLTQKFIDSGFPDTRTNPSPYGNYEGEYISRGDSDEDSDEKVIANGKWKIVYVREQWDPNANDYIVEIDNPTWKDIDKHLWTSQEVTLDEHHIFLEGIYKNDSTKTMIVSCGS